MHLQELSTLFLTLEEQSSRCTNGTLPREERHAYIQGVLRFLIQLQIDVVGSDQALAFSSLRPESQVAIRYLDELNGEMALLFEGCQGNMRDDAKRILSFIRQEEQAKKIKQETLPLNIEQYDPALEELIAYHRGTIRLLTLAKMAAYCISGLAAEDYGQISDLAAPKKARAMIRNCHQHAKYFQQQQVSPGQSNPNLPLSSGFYGACEQSINIILVENAHGEIPKDTLLNETFMLEQGHEGEWSTPVRNIIVFPPYGRKYEQKKANILTPSEVNTLYQIELFSLSHFASPKRLQTILNCTVICPGEHQTDFFVSPEAFWQQAEKTLAQTQPLLEKLNHTQATKGKWFPEFVANTITKICYALQGMGTHLRTETAASLARTLLPVLRDISQKQEYRTLLKDEIKEALNNKKETPQLVVAKRTQGRRVQKVIHPTPVSSEGWHGIEQFCTEVLEPMSKWQPQRGKKILWREHVGRIIAHQIKAQRYCKFTPKEGMNPTTYQIIRDIHAHPDTAARVVFLSLVKGMRTIKNTKDANSFLNSILLRYQESEEQLRTFSQQGDLAKVLQILSPEIQVSSR